MKKYNYDKMGLDIATKITLRTNYEPEELIGGLASTIKMFSTIADFTAKDIEMGEVTEDNPKADEVLQDIEDLTSAILTSCNEDFSGYSLNTIMASLANATLKIVLTRDTIRNGKSDKYYTTLDEIMDQSENDHECYAECPSVRECPKGKKLFPKGKAKTEAKEETATAKEEATVTREASDTFETLMKALIERDEETSKRILTELLMKNK